MCLFIKIFLKKEYWAPEALAMEQLYTKENNTLEEEEEPDNTQSLRDLIELWTSVGLYIYVGHQLVSDLPDTELQYVYFYCHLNGLLQQISFFEKQIYIVYRIELYIRFISKLFFELNYI